MRQIVGKGRTSQADPSESRVGGACPMNRDG